MEIRVLVLGKTKTDKKAEYTLCRELSKDERAGIKKLVIEKCANHERAKGACVAIGKPCRMICEAHYGKLCRYFRRSVLPGNPILEGSVLEKGESTMKCCAVCGVQFAIVDKMVFCSSICEARAARKKPSKKPKGKATKN